MPDSDLVSCSKRKMTKIARAIVGYKIADEIRHQKATTNSFYIALF